jgi:hypothetical protein
MRETKQDGPLRHGAEPQRDMQRLEPDEAVAQRAAESVQDGDAMAIGGR